MKIKNLTIGLTLLCSLQSLSQQLPSIKSFSMNDFSPKKEFVYKTVDGHEIKANIFLPQTNGLLPVVVYFHGGGFIFGNRDQGLNNDLKERLLSENFAVVSADYRLAPETKLNEILTDVRDIIKWLRLNGSQQFNVDTSWIAVVGGSAGGYLALSTGFKNEAKPNAIVAISTPTGFSSQIDPMGDLAVLKQPGPYDIVTSSAVSYGDYSSRMTLCRFLIKNGLGSYEIFGFDPAKEPKKLDRFTLTNNIKTDFPPTLIIHAKNDRLVDLQQVKDFYQFLTNKQIYAELFLVENGHDNELIKQNPAALNEIIKFLNTQFKR